MNTKRRVFIIIRIKNNETRQMFTSVIAAGKCSILMLTPDLYKEAKENGALAPLSETLGYTPDNAFDEYSVFAFRH